MVDLEAILTLISIISTLCAIIFGILAFSRSKRIDNKHEGEKNASILTQMNYIIGGVDEMKRKIEAQEQRYVECSIKLAKNEAIANKAHDRLDILSGCIQELKRENEKI